MHPPVSASMARSFVVFALVVAMLLGVTCAASAERHAESREPVSHHVVHGDACDGSIPASGASSTSVDRGAVASADTVAAVLIRQDIAVLSQPIRVPPLRLALFLLHASLLI